MATTKKTSAAIEHVSFASWKLKNKIKAPINFMTTKKGRFTATVDKLTLMTTEGFDSSKESFIVADMNGVDDLMWVYNRFVGVHAFSM